MQVIRTEGEGDNSALPSRARKGVPASLAWSPGHGLVQCMSALSQQFLENPMGSVGRVWIVGGRRFFDTKPDKETRNKAFNTA